MKRKFMNFHEHHFFEHHFYSPNSSRTQKNCEISQFLEEFYRKRFLASSVTERTVGNISFVCSIDYFSFADISKFPSVLVLHQQMMTSPKGLSGEKLLEIIDLIGI